MFKIIFVWIIISGVTSCYAVDNIIDDPTMLYSVSDTILDTRITIKRTFYNINDLVSELNSINGLGAKILSQSSVKSVPVYVYVDNGNLVDLLNQTAKKLGYNWSLNNNQILFSASVPVIPQLARPNPPLKTWAITLKDKTLRGALTKWCNMAGWQLVWNVNSDYMINVSWELNGSFESAVNEVLQATKNMEPPLKGIMHDSNKVLEIYSPLNSKYGML
jgi:hypothetical protein